MTEPLTAILIGAGNRGQDAYAPYALQRPDQLHFVAVAEPLADRRARFASAHGIPPDGQYATWQELVQAGKVADVALVCTLDSMHVEPAVACMELGYDVLLEKPMATTLADCVRLVQTAERTGRLLQVCHELRYTQFFTLLKGIVDSGRLGRVITVEHRENVSYWHMAHSYVRGNWRNSQLESPMILAKCCHDLDILYWILGPSQALSSIGSLLHYRAENAPPGAPERCTDGCPADKSCPWYAPRLYLDLIPLLRMTRESPVLWERWASRLILDHPAAARWAEKLVPGFAAARDYRGWPISVLSEDTSREARLQALKTGPYGRCVYRCDNDVVDHQVVNLEQEDGTSIALIMHGHSHFEGRTMRWDGTRATLFGSYNAVRQEIQIHDHLTGKVETLHPTAGPVGATGHGGADLDMMRGFLQAVRDRDCALTTARHSLESHLLAFAAEQARVTGTVIDMAEFRRSAG